MQTLQLKASSSVSSISTFVSVFDLKRKQQKFRILHWDETVVKSGGIVLGGKCF